MTSFLKSGAAFGAFLFLCSFAAGAVSPAYAEGSVSSLGMGAGAKNATEFFRYQAVVKHYNGSGERFRIDSECRSACMMFLAIRNVCVSPGASLAFHAGNSPERTQQMMSTYNAALRKHLTANGAMETKNFHTISGRDIISRFGYKACS